MASIQKSQVHAFVDSTDLTRKKATDLASTVPQRLVDAARAIDARLYVTELSVEEIANLQLRELQAAHKSLSRFAGHVSLPALSDDASLREALSAAARTALEAIPATIIPMSFDTADLLALSQDEATRIEKKKDLGFADAMHFLASLRYAAGNGLADCWFISNDNGFDAEALTAVAARRGVKFRLYQGTDAAVAEMLALERGGLRSLETEPAKEALRFVTEQTAVLRAFLAADPRFNQRVAQRLTESAVTYVHVIPLSLPRHETLKNVRIDAAIPVGAPREGVENQITFHGRAVMDITVERPPRVERSPWVLYVGSSPQRALYHSPGRLETQEIAVPIAGEVRAVFRAGKFQAPMAVQSIDVRQEG